MKKKILILFLAALAIFAGILAWNRFVDGSKNGRETHTGTVEAEEVTVSFRIPGHVDSVLFEEGEYIKAGQTLAVLDTTTLSLEVKRTRAALDIANSRLSTARARAAYLKKAVQAQIEGAEANLEKLESGLRPQEVEAARQRVEKARAQADKARAGAERSRRLYKSGVIPFAKLEDAQTIEQVSRAALLGAEENLDIAETGTRTEDIRAARAAVNIARARRDEVRAAGFEVKALENEVKARESESELALTRLGYATLRSPLSGSALTKNIEPGENITATRPVTTIADLAEVKLRFYIPANRLETLNPGDNVTVLSEASPGKQFSGRVSYISEQAEFTPKSILTKEERTKLVYMVRALVPNPDRKLKPGMPVDIILDQ